MKYLILTIFAALILACSSETGSEPGTAKDSEAPEKIIFLIGDGMGLSAISTGYYFQDEKSQFSRFKQIGLIKTSSASHKITDSGAAGTALACGTKSYNGAIGVDTLKNSVVNISEIVSDLGWSTGVAASSSITHATPASFYAHVPSRSMEESIAMQLLQSEIDFFAGGGTQFFKHRKDGLDLFELASNTGFYLDSMALAEPGELEPGKKYGFILSQKGMPPITEGRGDFLPEATALALEYLSGINHNFFLMVEGSQIDWAGHGNDFAYTLGEMLDFEKVIRKAMDYAEKDGNTLVVITSDHETGGLALTAKTDPVSGKRDYDQLGPSYATGGHTATLIPVFAYGPGAENFTGIYDIQEVAQKMKALVAKE